ncbi:MAG: DNA gyrase inhibitor YacG [Burkholderiaceae bacterium]|nr:DNA gyrase inhibitor YacG [Burkholderiaceae bacterium]
MTTPASPRRVRCPTCGALAVYDATNPWRPFCSERCRQIDLGAWASEGYRVPSAPQPGEGEEHDPPPPGARH